MTNLSYTLDNYSPYAIYGQLISEGDNRPPSPV
jgi:hypothetical protein